MKLSVIIVNYNVKRFLYQCLRSVEAALASDAQLAHDSDIWVVDNASHDDSVDYLTPFFPQVHFIRNEENVGFSRANNHAIRFSEAEYVLLLNPDTIVSSSAISESVKWLDSHQDAGSVSVALHNANGAFALESRRGVPTPLVSFCKITGLNRIFPRHKVMGRYYMGFLDREKPVRIEILSGAYMMMRRKALDEVGLLDETFFMYGEDVDLSYRLLKGGWNNYYLPYPIIHYKGESEHPSTIRYVNVFHQAMIIFYEKHFNKRYFLSGLLIRMAVYFKAFLTLLKHGLSRLTGFLPRKESPLHYYCYCSDANKDKLMCLAKEEGSDITFMQLGELPAVNQPCSLYLFDATCYTYDEIIAMLIAHNAQLPSLYLATYTPETGILIA